MPKNAEKWTGMEQGDLKDMGFTRSTWWRELMEIYYYRTTWSPECTTTVSHNPIKLYWLIIQIKIMNCCKVTNYSYCQLLKLLHCSSKQIWKKNGKPSYGWKKSTWNQINKPSHDFHGKLHEAHCKICQSSKTNATRAEAAQHSPVIKLFILSIIIDDTPNKKYNIELTGMKIKF
jgi:hypothetical protein